MLDFQDMMKVVDAMRQQELQVSNNDDDDDTTNRDLLAPARLLFNAPGAKEGLATAALCVGVLLPIRRVVLRLGRQNNLADLPDLIFTPVIAIVALQCSLRVASLCGARTYLERVPHMNAETLHSLCSDATLQEIMQQKVEPPAEAKSVIWDPEAQALQAFHKALSTCKQR